MSNNRTTPEALTAYIDKPAVTLFENLHIMTERELQARYTVDLEEYTLRLQLKPVSGNIARNHVILLR